MSSLDHVFRAQEPQILAGDGMANVIQLGADEFKVTRPLGPNAQEAITRLGYRGITVVGDVHGMIEPLRGATEWAASRNLFCVFLGDYQGYGPGGPECVEHVYGVVSRGRGVSLIGNHERKIARWIAGRNHHPIRLSEGNRVMTSAIEQMSPGQRFKFETRFRALIAMSRHHYHIADTTFVHAAANGEILNSQDIHLLGSMESMALFGTTVQGAHGQWTTDYQWIDEIPGGHRVMVGHNIRSAVRPLVVKNPRGGEVYFMDTGCGKGGGLTTCDLLFAGNRLVPNSFTRH